MTKKEVLSLVEEAREHQRGLWKELASDPNSTGLCTVIQARIEVLEDVSKALRGNSVYLKLLAGR